MVEELANMFICLGVGLMVAGLGILVGALSLAGLDWLINFF